LRCVHFIGFRGEEYWSAVKVFGRPQMIHMGWDRRSQRDIGEDDIVVFAVGDETQPFTARNYPDIHEEAGRWKTRS
jgi:hypothetical protein